MTANIGPSPPKSTDDELDEFVRDLLRFVGLGIVSSIVFLFYTFFIYWIIQHFFPQTKIDVQSWTFLAVWLIYFTFLIAIIHAPILRVYRQHTVLPKKSIQASEYSYLLFALTGVLTLPSFGYDMRQVDVLADQQFMQEKVHQIDEILGRVEEECKTRIPERQTEDVIARACNWIESVSDYIETNLSRRAWEKLDIQRQELMRQPLVHNYKLPSFELRTFYSELQEIGDFMTIYFKAKQRAEGPIDPSATIAALWLKLLSICALSYSLAVRLGKLTAETLGVVEK
jgi:hypothetical protein